MLTLDDILKIAELERVYGIHDKRGGRRRFSRLSYRNVLAEEVEPRGADERRSDDVDQPDES